MTTEHDHEHGHDHHDHGLHPRHRPVNRAYLSNDTPVLGPVGYAVHEIRTKARNIIGPDFVRHGILFHNPNPCTTLRVFPDGPYHHHHHHHGHDDLEAGEGGIAIPPYAFFELYASTGGNLGEDWSRVRINTGWQVVADCNCCGHGLTVWDFTDRGELVQPTANLLIDVGIVSPIGRQYKRLDRGSTRILHHFQNRRGILFHNPGTAAKGIAPGNLDATIGAGSVVLLPGTVKEFRAHGKVRFNAPFNATTADDADGTLTALEYV